MQDEVNEKVLSLCVSGGKISARILKETMEKALAEMERSQRKERHHAPAKQKEEKQTVNVDRFLAVVKKYTNLTELTPEILHEFIDKILVHAPDKSSGRRLQEIEIIYNHIGAFDHSKITLWKGKAV